MEVTVTESDGSTGVAVSGEIDICDADQFSWKLRAAVLKADTAVELDLVHVTFMDSTGINALIRARRLAVERGVQLRIVKASTQVERVLEMMGLKKYFD